MKNYNTSFIISLSLTFIMSLTSFGQNILLKECGFDYKRNIQLQDSNYLKLEIESEFKIAQQLGLSQSRTLGSVYHIPVVVHVVWKTNAQNISDAQIQSQIDVLNNDYRRTNIDQINTPSVWQGIAADSEIEFCLASVDPNGQPTNGINRVQTTHGQFGMSNDIHTSSAGGADDWPNDDYLNIWVCDIANSLLGYASPPSNWIGSNDGVVVGYKYFGNSNHTPYHKGRTATHEVGHWLNLEHIWSDS